MEIVRIDTLGKGTRYINRIAGLYLEYLSEYGYAQEPYSLERLLNKLIARGRIVILVAESEGEILGFATVSFGFSSVAACESLQLEDIYVIKNVRRKGVGKALMRELEAMASELGKCRIFADIDMQRKTVLNFYHGQRWKNLGYVVHTKEIGVKRVMDADQNVGGSRSRPERGKPLS